MLTYQSKNHKGVYVTTDGVVDPKYKTVLITFADGKTQSITHPTLKSQWILVDNSVNQPKDSLLSSIQIFAESVAHTMGCSVKAWEHKPNMLSVLNPKGKSCMEIVTSRKALKCRVKSVILKDDEERELHSYNLDATVTLPYDENGYSALQDLITRSIIYNTTKPKQTRKRRKQL